MTKTPNGIAVTNRLILRAFRESDFDAFADIVGDSTVMALVGDNRPLSRERARNWLLTSVRRHESGEPATYAVCLKDNHRLIGYGGFTARYGASDEIEIIYGLAKDSWGQGFGGEVAKALVEVGFDRFARSHLWATVDPANTASIRIIERLGIVSDGLKVHQFPQYSGNRGTTIQRFTCAPHAYA